MRGYEIFSNLWLNNNEFVIWNIFIYFFHIFPENFISHLQKKNSVEILDIFIDWKNTDNDIFNDPIVKSQDFVLTVHGWTDFYHPDENDINDTLYPGLVWMNNARDEALENLNVNYIGVNWESGARAFYGSGIWKYRIES